MSSSTNTSAPAPPPFELYMGDTALLSFPKAEDDLLSRLDMRDTDDAGVICVGCFKEDARAWLPNLPAGPIDAAVLDSAVDAHEGRHALDLCRIVIAQPIRGASGTIEDAELFAIYLRRGRSGGSEQVPNALAEPFVKISDWCYVQFELRLLNKHPDGGWDLYTSLSEIRSKIVAQLKAIATE